MWKILKFFNIHPKDWMLVWTVQGEWVDNLVDKNPNAYCQFNIYFSKSRDKFRLDCEGLRPKNHNGYGRALSKLAEYNNTLLEIQFKGKKKAE